MESSRDREACRDEAGAGFPARVDGMHGAARATRSAARRAERWRQGALYLLGGLASLLPLALLAVGLYAALPRDGRAARRMRFLQQRGFSHDTIRRLLSSEDAG